MDDLGDVLAIFGIAVVLFAAVLLVADALWRWRRQGRRH